MSGECSECGEHCLDCRCNEICGRCGRANRMCECKPITPESLDARISKVEEVLNSCLYILAEVTNKGEHLIIIGKAQKKIKLKKKRRFYIRGVTPLTKGRKRPGEK